MKTNEEITALHRFKRLIRYHDNVQVNNMFNPSFLSPRLITNPRAQIKTTNLSLYEDVSLPIHVAVKHNNRWAFDALIEQKEYCPLYCETKDRAPMTLLEFAVELGDLYYIERAFNAIQPSLEGGSLNSSYGSRLLFQACANLSAHALLQYATFTLGENYHASDYHLKRELEQFFYQRGAYQKATDGWGRLKHPYGGGVGFKPYLYHQPIHAFLKGCIPVVEFLVKQNVDAFKYIPGQILGYDFACSAWDFLDSPQKYIQDWDRVAYKNDEILFHMPFYNQTGVAGDAPAVPIIIHYKITALRALLLRQLYYPPMPRSVPTQRSLPFSQSARDNLISWVKKESYNLMLDGSPHTIAEMLNSARLPEPLPCRFTLSPELLGKMAINPDHELSLAWNLWHD
jgi:hypothetical protein